MEFKIARIKTKDGKIARIRVPIKETEEVLGSKALGEGIEKVKSKKQFSDKFWESLKIPREMSSEGLTKMAEMVPSIEPTGNAFRDVALNTPKIMAETVAETAPEFVSRESIVGGAIAPTVKALRPAITATGRFAGSTAEKLSGLDPFRKGVLQRTFNDPTTPFRRGVEYAKSQYKNLEDIGGGIRESLTDVEPKKMVRRAINLVKNGEQLTADEAQKVKVALWDSRKANILDKSDWTKWYGKFKEMAASKYGEISPKFARAVDAETLRNVQPLNIHGTPSSFKTALLGGFLPKAAGLASPIVQGIGAATLGAGAKVVRPIMNLPYGQISEVGSAIGASGNILSNKKKKK